MLEAVDAVLGWLRKMPAAVAKARTQEGEQLADVVVRHLVAY
jgi:hypothetical protein